MLTD
jgi:hypothetical protein